MKLTPLNSLPDNFPKEVQDLFQGAKIYDSSCSPEAKVYFIDKDDGYYLKTASQGSLKREAQMTDYFHKIGLGARVLNYISGKDDILLTSAVIGDDCTTKIYLDDPKRLADTMAEMLWELHNRDTRDCPIQDRTGEYLSVAEKNYHLGRYDKSHFPDSFGYSSPEEAYAVLSSGKGLLKSEVIIHGDFCLPNIMLNGWRPAGFIDLGASGVGDRHIDLFWGKWTLGFNLDMIGRGDEGKKIGERFLDAYGRDRINDDAIRVVGAAEVFG